MVVAPRVEVSLQAGGPTEIRSSGQSRERRSRRHEGEAAGCYPQAAQAGCRHQQNRTSAWDRRQRGAANYHPVTVRKLTMELGRTTAGCYLCLHRFEIVSC